MRVTVLDETGWKNAPGRIDLGGAEVAVYTKRSAIVWGEHCTDCANPQCYSTCSLYTPRGDLKCRRFRDGLVYAQVQLADGSTRLAFDVAFRKWGKLEGEGSPALFGAKQIALLEKADRTISRLLDSAVIPYVLRRVAVKLWNQMKQRALRNVRGPGEQAGFLLEAINNAKKPARISVSIVNAALSASRYEVAEVFAPGYNRLFIPTDAIAPLASLGRHMRIAIEPVGDDLPEMTVLTADFVDRGPDAPAVGGIVTAGKVAAPTIAVATEQASPAARPQFKCVVWDLDNTLWKGVLVEDGAENLVANAAAIATIVELDRRGILNSVASKNDFALAEPVLRRLGLLDYFLFPEIGWGPKSDSVAQIAKSLNIGSDTFLFVDDQPFERAEVEAALPQVETIDISELDSILLHPRAQAPETAESATRRQMYRQEIDRSAALRTAGSNYVNFLRSCAMSLDIDLVRPENISRVIELAERTNQLNYSARRLSRAQVEETMQGEASRWGLVLSASDKFGSYGVIGFARVDRTNWRVEDFFMSCRVQRKRVDHAFFDWLRRQALAAGAGRLEISYVASAKNKPAREVLADEMKLSSQQVSEGGERFWIDVSNRVVDAEVVEVASHVA